MFAKCIIILFLALRVSSLEARENKEKLAELLENLSPGGVVIFDLDDTIFNVSTRTMRIIQNFIAQQETRSRFPAEVERIKSKFKLEHLGYGKPSLFLTAIDIKTPEQNDFLQALDGYWLQIFFSNEGVTYDEIILGSVEYVKAIAKKGGVVVYLTGRNAPNMLEGTLKALRTQGLPVELIENAYLFMKPAKERTDEDFKLEAFKEIQKLGPVVGVFENEPKNIILMKDTFPDAVAIFLNTQSTGKSMEELVNRADIFWVSNYNLKLLQR